ncbi:MAG: aminotransferase class V-fold PLP-dependent enzyme [Dehalococcoidia bacterium]
MIYLDNAATSWPKPESVYQAMDKFLRESAGNPGRGGHSLALAAERVIDETRLLVARLINAPEKDRIIFTFNCTDALNMGLKGLLKAGDHVITSQIGHNSLVRPLRKLEAQGVRVTRLPPFSEDGFLSARDLEQAINEETKLVIVTHASNVTGVVQPIEEYGAAVRKRGRIFMVDAAQTAGTYPIDVQASNIDLLAFPGHKGLLGPPGTGVLCIGDRVELDSLREGGTGSQSELEEQPITLPHRYESGTPNTVGIAGLGAGLKYIFERGVDKIRSYEQSLLSQLLEGLSEIPETVLHKPEETEQAPIVAFNLEGWEPAEVGAVLDQAFDIKVRTGLHCAAAAHKVFGTYPQGSVRISMSCLNTPQDIEAVLQALRRITDSKQAAR